MCFPCTLRADVALSHQAWSVEEGLPQPSVHQVYQSRDGFLWLATEGGVARFDGYAFKTFSHQNEPAFLSDDVSAIAETSDGLWFGTASGLMKYQHSEWHRFAESDGLSSSTVLALAAAGDGSLLVLTPSGVDRFDGTRFRALPTGDESITALQPTQDGGALMLGAGGVWRYQHGSIQRQDLPGTQGRRAAALQGVQRGLDGAVWTRTASFVGVSRPPLQRGFAIGRELPHGRITALFVDRQGTGWIGTNHGLFFVKAEASSEVQAVDALRLESVLCISEDREGNLWIGTEISGLHALRPSKFHAEPAAMGEAVNAGTVAADGTLWFGTEDDGVRRVRNATAEQPVRAGSLTSPVILAMAHGREGDVWVGTPDGLNQIAGDRVAKLTYANGLPDDYVRSVMVDGHGTVWASTRRGLVRVEGSGLRTYTQLDGLGSDSVGPVVENTAHAVEGAAVDLWIGTAAGLSHLHRGNIQNFTASAGPSGSVVTALAEERDGTLWVGLHGQGLAMFAGDRFTSIHNAGVPVEVTALAVDGLGYLWLRGVHGVYRVALAALHACATRPFLCDFSAEEYGVADGLPSEAGTSAGVSSIWRSSDDRLWFPTRKGIGVVDPLHLPINRVPPPVAIEEFAVDDVEVPLHQADIRLDSGHRRYTFAYAALSYTLPARNRYRYQLEGFDSQWIDGGTSRTASYTSLPFREYRFRVQAQNNDGVWSETDAAVSFRILPPFYRTWWFSCLVVLLAAALVLTVLWLQTRAVRTRFDLVLAERTRIARDVHDTLAQDLVSVSLQLSLAKRFMQTNNVEQATSQLEETRKLVMAGLEAVRQSIWNLRADTAEDSLPTRLTQLVRQYSKSEHPPSLKIGGAYRRLAPRVEAEVLRIAQESLSNVARHAAATEIAVTLHYEPDALSLTIRDNGRGFSPEEARAMQGHYGLLGMQERAETLRAQLTTTSSIGGGTTVSLYLPLGDKEHRTF